MEVKRRTAEFLVEKLSSVSERTRNDALCELRLISKHDAESRTLIAGAGAIPHLAETLYSSSHEVQENAAATLLNISISSKDSLMSTRGLLDAFSHILRSHSSTSPAAVQSSSAALYSLLTVDSNRRIIGAKRDIVYALIDIIRNPSSPPRSIKDALGALFGVSLYPLNRSTMIHLGAAGPLFGLILKDDRVGIVEDATGLILKDDRVGIVEDATAVVAQIAGCEESEEAFRNVSGISVLVDLLDMSTGSNMRIKENAVSALLNLARCCREGRVMEHVRRMCLGVVDGILNVAEDGTDKGKSKAAALLDLINTKTLSSCSGGSPLRDSQRRYNYMLHQSS
ncbi:hypothetical protein SAY87_031122 [Trapa incisa]|uniref:U-box domain-containing protein n=1 Tax=Trapa incisa TaxID=236973 RepID=A0AAN7KVF9_9MYRT|nr:hypothetical protein SAY87_031122 [Trapa incisa]